MVLIRVPQFDQWPGWVQTIVILPNAILGYIATWLWWPKSERGRKKFGFVAAYLLLFLLAMHFVSSCSALVGSECSLSPLHCPPCSRA
jgi:hypothetical protein